MAAARPRLGRSLRGATAGALALLGLAGAAADQSAYIGDTLIPRLYSVDLAAGANSIVPPDLGAPNQPVIDLAVDRLNQRLYVLTARGLNVYRIDRQIAPAKLELVHTAPLFGTHLALSLDGRTAYVAEPGRVTSTNLYPTTLYKDARPEAVPAFSSAHQVVHPLPHPDRAIAAMGIHPAGDRLFVVLDLQPNDKKLAITNDLLRSDVGNGTRVERLRDADLPSDFGYLTQLDITAAVDTTGDSKAKPRAFAAPVSLRKLTYDEPPKAETPDVPTAGVALGISSLTFSPDGNCLYLTARGAQTPRATAFGVIPTTDEGTGGIVVLDVRPTPEPTAPWVRFLRFIPTTEKGEDTAALRMEIRSKGWRIVHPLVQYARNNLSVAQGQLDVSLASGNPFTTGPSLTAFTVYSQVLGELEDSFKDYGYVQAYNNLYPRDMVGASGLAVDHTGDFGVVTLQHTNNLGLLTLGTSAEPAGFTPANPPDSFIARGTGKTINSYGDPSTSNFSSSAYSWAYPQQPAFTVDDSRLFIGMAGGTPKADNSNVFGSADAKMLRTGKDRGDSPFAGGNPPPGYIPHSGVELRSPRKVATHQSVDFDSDGFSDQLEAFNRFNSQLTLPRDPGNLRRAALISTEATRLSDPGTALPPTTHPTDILDQALLLPSSGPGYRLNQLSLETNAANAGSRSAIAAIERFGRAWSDAYAAGKVTRPYFLVGSIAPAGGGPLRNAGGEVVKYGPRNGFQVDFLHLGFEAADNGPATIHSDRPYDLVLSNTTDNPRDNSIENFAGFDTAHMRFLLELLLAEPTVARIELDPAVRDILDKEQQEKQDVTNIDFADPRFEYHGIRSLSGDQSTNYTRRDLDSFLCVSFSPLRVDVVVAPPPPADPGKPDQPVPAGDRRFYTVTLPPPSLGLDRAVMRVVLSLPEGAPDDAFIVRTADGRIVELGKEYSITELFGGTETLGLWIDVLAGGELPFAFELLYPGMDNLYSLHDTVPYIQWIEDPKPANAKAPSEPSKPAVARHIANCSVGSTVQTDASRTTLYAATQGFDAPVTYRRVAWESAPTDTPTEDPSEPTVDPVSGLVQAGKDSGTLYVEASAITPDGREVLTRTLAIEVGGCGGCVTCTDAGSVEFSAEGLDFHIGDGNEGKLRFRAALPTPELLSPFALEYPYFTPATRIVRTPAGAMRQISTEKVFFDIVPTTANQGFTVKVYRPGAGITFDKAAGLYSVSGTPLHTITVARHPDLAQDGLVVTHTQTGTPQRFAYAYTDGGWTLQEHLDPATNKPARQQRTAKRRGDFFGQTAELTERTMSDGEGTVVSKEVTVTAEVRPGVSRLVGRISDPDGANRITRYTYNALDLVETVTYPNGRWTRYEYDGQKRVTKQVEPWLDTAPGAPEAQCRVTTFDYTPLSAADTGALPEAPRTSVVYALGTEIARSYDHYVGQRHDSITALKPGATWDDPANLVTSSTTVASGFFAGRTESVKNPDGTMTLTTYAFNPGGGETTITKSGVPNAAGDDILDGTESTNRTNAKDQTIESTTVDIASGLTLSSQITLDFDLSGRPTRWLYLDGSESSTVYGCCGVESETDRNGLVTTYEYDAFKRTKAVHRLGLTTKYEYDTRGRTLKTIQVATDGTELVASRTEYLDAIGDSVDSFDPLDRKTSSRVAYNADGTTTRTTTLPGGFTQWQKSSRDGRPLETGGTAAAPSRYEYRIEKLGEIPCSVTRAVARVWDAGTSIFNDSQWTETWSDMAGRTLRVVMADGAKAENFYNEIGQLVRSVDPDGVTTLYAYNTRGEQHITAVDLDRDGVIDFDGADRITRSTSVVTTKTWAGQTYTVAQSTSEVWAAEDADTPLTVSVQAQSIDGRHAWTESFGATAHQETIYPEKRDGSWTVKATAPDGTSTVTQYTAGRLDSASQISNSGSQIHEVTYGYDTFGRANTVTDPRTGTTTTTFYADGQVDTVKAPHPELAGQFQTTKNFYNERGLLEKRQLPDGSEVSYTYTPQGQLETTHGSQTYPLAYAYDSQGRMLTMTTWQDFAGDTGKATTTWQYDPQRGTLAAKIYSPKSLTPAIPADAPVRYTYTDAGRLKTRTWSRGLTTTYGYGQDGALASVDYSDSTPDIAYGYRRLGQVKEVRDGVLANGTISDTDLRYRHEYSLTAELRPDTETIHTLGTFTLHRHYESTGANEVPGRYAGYTLSGLNSATSSFSSLSSVGYRYDSAGRLEKVTSDAGTFTYGYLPNTGLIETVTGPVHTVHNTYQPFGYGLQSKTNKAGETVVSKFEYRLNDLGQRTAMITTGTAFAQSMQYQYRYNEKGEVIAGDRYQGTDLLNPGPAIPTDTFSYRYDDIGNRIEVGRGVPAEPLLKETYQSNLLNQYTGIVSQISDSQITDSPVHDADGNLVSDSRWLYTWNAENRLIEMETAAAVAAGTPKQKLTFTYDYQGRRISKRVFTWNAATDLWEPAKSTAFVYDGWNLLAELAYDPSPDTYNLIRSYVWGFDLSGSLQGAGGVGGLLAVTTPHHPSPITHYPSFDANGNVSEYLDATGAPAAHFEYSPFGQTIRTTFAAPLALQSLGDGGFRFSTKYTDSETDLLYYGLRYYNPSTGRWLSRDPIGETGGRNLYAMVGNDPVSVLDYLGLAHLSSSPAQTGCKTGQKQCPNNKPSSNGCGTDGWKGKLVPERPFWMIDFASACNKHDICYGTCGNDKGTCDREFLGDMQLACELEYGVNEIVFPGYGAADELLDNLRKLDPRVIRHRTCMKLAQAYYTAVSAAGAGPYKDAQTQACKCCCPQTP